MIRSVGIDLGTSNTLVYQFSFMGGVPYSSPAPVAICYPDECDFPSQSGALSFPSVLYLKESGNEIRPYVGAIAELLISNNPDCPEAKLFNTKRLMGTDGELAHGYTAGRVAEEFYRCCGYSLIQSRDFHRKRQWDQIPHVCITRPAAFDPYGVHETINAAAKAMKEAAETVARRESLQASAPKIEVLEEPQAALLTFLYESLNDPEARDALLKRQNERSGVLRVAVVDIGGGTTDVSVQMLSITGDQGAKNEDDEYVAGAEYATNYTIQFINHEMADGSRSHFNPHRDFGGLDFDQAAAGHLVKRLSEECQKEGFNLALLSDDEKMHIRNIAMMAAKEFKDSGRTDGVWMPKLDFVGFNGIVVVSYRRDEYDAWVSDLIGSSRTPPWMSLHNKTHMTIYSIIADTLKSANLQPSDLDYMYVTGGMSLYPPVYTMLQEEFGKETTLVRSKVNALNDIAMGASLFNTYFQVKKDASILEENLMLDLPEGEPVILAQAGKPLPQEKTVNFPIVNPVEIALDILMGQNPLSPDLHKIKMLRAHIPMTRIGTPVELKFRISQEQRIQLTLYVKSEVKPFEIPIDTSFNQNVARGEKE